MVGTSMPIDLLSGYVLCLPHQMTSRLRMACRYGASICDWEGGLCDLAALQRTGSCMQSKKSVSSVRRQTPCTSRLSLTTLSFLNVTTRGQRQKKIPPGPTVGEPPRAGSDPVSGVQL